MSIQVTETIGKHTAYFLTTAPTMGFEKRLKDALRKARGRAERLSLPFDLTITDLLEVWPEDAICPATHTRMVFGAIGGRANSPSIDRINPELGYVRGNVQWLCLAANTTKATHAWLSLPYLGCLVNARRKQRVEKTQANGSILVAQEAERKKRMREYQAEEKARKEAPRLAKFAAARAEGRARREAKGV